MLGTLVEVAPLKTGDILTIASVIVAGAGLVLATRNAARQLSSQALTARGQFLITLNSLFKEHEDIHMRLRNKPPDYEWWKGDHPSDEDWAKVETYMGLFERVWLLVEGGSIDIEVIERLYGYRVFNLIFNDRVRARKLEDPSIARYWIDFIELWRALDRVHVERLGTVLSEDHPAPPPPYPYEDTA